MTTSFEAAKAAMTPTEVLIAARKLCEKGWIQGPSHEFGNGQCHCPMTAIGRSGRYGTDPYKRAVLFLARAIGAACDSVNAARGAIWAWNDHPSRTLAEVLAAFDRAIEF